MVSHIFGEIGGWFTALFYPREIGDSIDTGPVRTAGLVWLVWNWQMPLLFVGKKNGDTSVGTCDVFLLRTKVFTMESQPVELREFNLRKKNHWRRVEPMVFQIPEFHAQDDGDTNKQETKKYHSVLNYGSKIPKIWFDELPKSIN